MARKRCVRKQVAAVNFAVFALLGTGGSVALAQVGYTQNDFGQTGYLPEGGTFGFPDDTFWDQLFGIQYQDGVAYTNAYSNWSYPYINAYPNDPSVNVLIDRGSLVDETAVFLDVSVDIANLTLGNVTSNSGLTMFGGTTLSFHGSNQVNDGTILVAGDDTDYGDYPTSVNFVNSSFLGGSGNINLQGLQATGVYDPYAQVAVYSGATLTVGGSQTIQVTSTGAGDYGHGQLVLAGDLNNCGTIYSNAGEMDINSSGSGSNGILENVGIINAGGAPSVIDMGAIGTGTCAVINTSSMGLTGIIEATDGGVVNFNYTSSLENSEVVESYGTNSLIMIASPTVTNSIGGTNGQIIANGGTVDFLPTYSGDSTVTGGTISATNSGVIELNYGSTLSSVVVTVDSGAQMLVGVPYGIGGAISDSTITDNGTVLVNGGTLYCADTNLLTGSGTLTLTGSGAITVKGGGTLTQDVHHTITGSGGAGINVSGSFDNNGIIDATGTMYVSAPDDYWYDFPSFTAYFTNTNVSEATGGGSLQFDFGMTVNNSGTIEAVGSTSNVIIESLYVNNGTSGQIIANAGTVTLSNTDSGTLVATVCGGTLSAINAGTLQFQYTNYPYNEGSDIHGAAISIDSTSALESPSYYGNGSITDCTVTNNGTILCDTNTLAISGSSITQGTNGLIATVNSGEIDINNTFISGGSMNTSDYGTFKFCGTSTFTGTITNNSEVSVVGSQTVVIGRIVGAGLVNIGDGTNPAKLKLSGIFQSSTVGSLTINSNAALDITDNKLIINFTPGYDPVSTIESYLSNGYNGGAWTGTSYAINSSSAAATYGGSHPTSIGYADGNVDTGISGLQANQIRVMYTLAGDANLDGTVNFTDYGIVGQHLNTTGNDWAQGNFTYASNGAVTFTDLGIVGQNMNQSISVESGGPPTVILPIGGSGLLENRNTDAPLPEPDAFALFLACAGGLLQRRSRKAAKLKGNRELTFSRGGP